MKKKLIFGLSLLLLTTAACTLFSKDEKKAVEEEKSIVLEKDFLWQRMGDSGFIEFMTEFRCLGNDDDGYSDAQITLLKKNNIDELKYELENQRADWFTEYADSGLEEKIRAEMKVECPETK